MATLCREAQAIGLGSARVEFQQAVAGRNPLAFADVNGGDDPRLLGLNVLDLTARHDPPARADDDVDPAEPGPGNNRNKQGAQRWYQAADQGWYRGSLQRHRCGEKIFICSASEHRRGPAAGLLCTGGHAADPVAGDCSRNSAA